MSVTHPVAIRNSLCNSIVDLVDAGADNGKLVFMTSADVEVATLEFSDPAFGDASNGTATAAAITPDNSATGGTIAKAKAVDSDDNECFACSVSETGGGGDIELTSVVVSPGQQVSLAALTYSAPL